MLFGSFYSSEGESVFSFNNSTAALGGDINTISYPLFSDFRIDVKLKNAERKVDYVIESPNFLNQFSGEFFVIEEQMKLPIGWKLLERNGLIDIVNEENIVVASIGEIIYYDANRSKENNGGIQRNHYEFDLLDNGNYVLKAKISLSWLTDPQRQFPIVIDPSISASNTDTYNNNYYWNDDGTNNRQLTTSGALANSSITSVDFTVSGEVSYYGGSCNSWWTYQITSAGSNVASGCNGSSFPTTFDGENPNQTWTVTAIDLDGYPDGLGYQFTIVVNYDEPSAQPPVISSLSSTAVCSGSTLTISGSNLTGATSVTIGGASATITANSSTSISVTVGSTSGTVSVTTSAGTDVSSSSVSVTAPPNAGTLSGTNVVCDNTSSTTFSSNGDSGGNWTSSNNSVATVGYTTGLVSPQAVGSSIITYTVTGTGGCSNETATRTLVVNAVPTGVSASASETAICSGSSIDLTSTTPALRTMYSEDFSSASTGTMAAYNANDRSSYSQAGAANSSNCATGKWRVADSYANNSYGASAPNTFSGNYGLCRYVSSACTQHELLISPPLYPSGATSMTFSVDFYFSAWTLNSYTDYLAVYFVNETDNALVGTQIYTTTQSGTSTYTLTFDGTNASTDVYSLRVEYAGQDDDGAVVDNLLVTATGSETYAWASDVGGYSSSANDPTNVSPTENTTYTLTYSDFTGCSSTATTSVDVDSQPSISSQPSDGSDVCTGATPSTMSVTATGGSGSYTYQWYSNTSDSNSGGSSIGSATNSTYVPDASTAGTTFYYCVVSDAQTGCNDATSNTASQVVNSAAAGSITSSVDGGSNYTSAQKTIKVGTDIYWQYSADGTNGTFSEFQYNWDNSSTYLNNFGGTSSPHSWGAGQTFGADGIIYVRAKVTCGTDEAFTSNIPTNWVYNYGGTDANGTTSDITASLSGSPSSISNGGDMRIDQTVTWTKPSTSFETSTFRWEYEWNNDGNWVDWTSSNPNSWSDNVGTNVSGGDAVIAVRTKHSGSGNAAYSNEFAVTLKKPVITTSGSLSAFASCEGSAATAQSFNVSGSYLGSDITVTAPTGFEVCATSNGTYASSITYSPTNGTLASSAVYVRLASTASGSPSGNVTCSATAATSATVAASGTASAAPTITTATDLNVLLQILVEKQSLRFHIVERVVTVNGRIQEVL